MTERASVAPKVAYSESWHTFNVRLLAMLIPGINNHYEMDLFCTRSHGATDGMQTYQNL